MSWMAWAFISFVFFGGPLLEFGDRQLKRYHERRLLTLKRDRRMNLLEEKLDSVELQVVDAILDKENPSLK